MDADLRELIKLSIENMDKERQQIKENSGYFVQYSDCGHAVEISYKHPLVAKCKQHTQIDALIRPWKECPVCHKTLDPELYIKVIYGE